MFIIDKNKDYYDHLSYIYGVDKQIVYDRRGSKILSDENLWRMVGENTNHYLYGRSLLLLEIGYTQFLIRLIDEKTHIDECSCTKFVSCNFEVLKIYDNYKNYFKQPLSLRECKVKHNWSGKYDKRVPKLSGIYEQDIIEVGVDVITYFPSVYNNPILKNTSLTSLVENEVIWREIQNYISSLKNDKDTDIMSNIEKIENYGFDKKTSFRNLIKQREK